MGSSLDENHHRGRKQITNKTNQNELLLLSILFNDSSKLQITEFRFSAWLSL